MKSKPLVGVIGAFALICVVAVKPGGWSPSESSTHVPEVEVYTSVEAASVTVGSITESIQAVGTLEAVASITVRPEIAGVIRRIHFQGGQVVERAAPLMELDPEELRSQVTQVEA
jgi:multidrug efflux pump subunit AcrA (membrane-fusion protein)